MKGVLVGYPRQLNLAAAYAVARQSAGQEASSLRLSPDGLGPRCQRCPGGSPLDLLPFLSLFLFTLSLSFRAQPEVIFKNNFWLRFALSFSMINEDFIPRKYFDS